MFVLTHHARKPLELKGGTTFHFTVDGIESALEQAREAAGDRDVLIAGGARTFQQYLAAALIDVVQLSVVPLLLGDCGARLRPRLSSVRHIFGQRSDEFSTRERSKLDDDDAHARHSRGRHRL